MKYAVYIGGCMALVLLTGCTVEKVETVPLQEEVQQEEMLNENEVDQGEEVSAQPTTLKQVPQPQNTENQEESADEELAEADEEKVTYPGQKTFHVYMRRYEIVPNVITVQKGDTVTLVVVSDDNITHGLHIEGLNVSQQAEAGERAEVTFTAYTAGEYVMRANVYSGEGHPTMKGTFIVTE